MNIRARPSSALGIKHIGASMKRTLVVGFLTVLGLLSVGCNGTAYGVLQPNPEDLFANARPIEPDILDFRHLAKHVPIPGIAAQEIGVDTILSWTQDVIVAPGCVANGAGASNVPCSNCISTGSECQCRRLTPTAMCTSRFL